MSNPPWRDNLNKLNIECVQANAMVGDIEGNLAKTLEYLSLSEADLLIFPECFITGYPLQDLSLRPSFLSKAENAIDRLAEAVKQKGGPAVLIGTVIPGSNLPFNGAHLLKTDGTRQTVFKTELPNNDVFDERRTFAMGENPDPIEFRGWKLGVMICEDMWHGEVARRLSDEGAQILIALNGSPMEIGKQNVRVGHGIKRVQATNIPLLYLNLCGGQDELVFDGSSFLLNDEGDIVLQRGMDEEKFNFQIEQVEYKTVLNVGENQIISYPDTYEAIYKTLCIGIRDYVGKNGFDKVMLGFSGGLDSAIVASLAVDALGADKVMTFMLPTQWTKNESKNLAEKMAGHIGCYYKSISVGAITNSLENILDMSVNDMDIDMDNRQLASENIQARARGNLLMAISNTLGNVLLLSTGNKSEMSVGYSTLYGDMCGGFNPIKDLYKTRVIELCRWRNANHRQWMKGVEKPILEEIINRPPSAELAEGQTDDDKLGSYPVLDAVLNCLIEDKIDPVSTARQVSRAMGESVDVEYTKRIARLVQVAEYKRRQSPPGTKLTARSFGGGWRYPITNKDGLL